MFLSKPLPMSVALILIALNISEAAVVVDSVDIHHNVLADSTAYYFNPQTLSVQYVPLGGSDSAATTTVALFDSALSVVTTTPDEYANARDFVPLGGAIATSTVQFDPAAPVSIDIAQYAGYSGNALAYAQASAIIHFSVVNRPAFFSLRMSFSTFLSSAPIGVVLERDGAPDPIVAYLEPANASIEQLEIAPGDYTFRAGGPGFGALIFGIPRGAWAQTELQMSVVPENGPLSFWLVGLVTLVASAKVVRLDQCNTRIATRG